MPTLHDVAQALYGPEAQAVLAQGDRLSRRYKETADMLYRRIGEELTLAIGPADMVVVSPNDKIDEVAAKYLADLRDYAQEAGHPIGASTISMTSAETGYLDALRLIQLYEEKAESQEQG